MNFGYVLSALKRGEAVRRMAWGDSYIKLANNGKSVLLYRIHEDSELWKSLSEDLLAEDWFIVDPDMEFWDV